MNTLRMHPWHFATTEVLISRIGTPISDFRDAYQLPADYIRFISVGGKILEWQRERYQLMGSRQIWINHSNSFGIQSGLANVVQVTTDTGPIVTGEESVETITTIITGQLVSNPSDSIGTAVNASINLRYVFNETNLTNWNQDALDLLSMFIASKVAYKITKSNALVQSIQKDIDRMLGALFAVSGQENPPLRIERSPAIERRRSLRSSLVASKYTIID
jgi:phosphoserine aminotransferase